MKRGQVESGQTREAVADLARHKARRQPSSIWQLLNRRKQERDLDDELRFHLEMEERELRQRGANQGEARRLAGARLGAVESIKEECRELRPGRSIEVLLQDLRYAWRTLRRSPAFTCAAVLTLALGIGANTAIFSLIHGVLLRPLPYVQGERLVVLEQAAPGAGIANVPFSIPEIGDLRQASSLSQLVEYHGMSFTLLGRGEPERVSTGVVSAEFFNTLGVNPLHGRTFVPEDDSVNAPAVLVLSHPYWQRSFGGDPDIVGQVFEMNNRPHTVVGVLPPIPEFPTAHDVYMSTSACPFRANAAQTADQNRRAFSSLVAFGRLANGATLDRLRSELSTMSARFQQDYPETYTANLEHQLGAQPLHQRLTQQARPTLFLLLASTVLVLLIACANVANLTAARILRRDRELAVRSSLGAGRGRLVRQLLVESTLLALAGGVCGLGLAYAGLGLLINFLGRFTPRATDVTVDGWVLAFTLIVSLFTGIAAGALPALSRREGHTESLRDGGGSGSGRKRQRLRAALITAQVAVSVLLLVGAGLMLRSLARLQQVDTGFAAEGVMAARITLNWTKYTSRQSRVDFFSELVRDLDANPAVITAAATNLRPFSGQRPFQNQMRLEGQPELAPGEVGPQVDLRRVTPGYFRTLGVPLVRGRTFDGRDDAEGNPVVVVNRELVRQHFQDQDPLGRRLSMDGGTNWATVVGVVGDVRDVALEASPLAAVYQPVAQNGFVGGVVVRSSMPPETLGPILREAVRRIDPDQPIDSMATLEQSRHESTASPRLTAMLLSTFAGLALLITATGISGLLAFAVGQRRREIGIRMALGAPRGGVLMMILRQGLTLVAVGLGFGLIASVAATLLWGSLISNLLFEIQPTDPITLVLVILVLTAVAAVACLLPARRAVKVDPSVTLRAD